MRRNSLYVAILAVIVFVADQASKFAVVTWVGMGGVWTPIPGRPDLIAITPGVNTGAVCGYFPQFGTLFTFAPFLILAIVILFYRSQRDPGWLLNIGTGLIIGGAFGNLVDRLRFGYVVDFIYVWHWPVFNIADAAVSTAVVLLLFWSLKEETSGRAMAPSPSTAASGTSWRLAFSFLGLLAVIAVLGIFVCVVLPSSLPR